MSVLQCPLVALALNTAQSKSCEYSQSNIKIRKFFNRIDVQTRVKCLERK